MHGAMPPCRAAASAAPAPGGSARAGRCDRHGDGQKLHTGARATRGALSGATQKGKAMREGNAGLGLGQGFP